MAGTNVLNTQDTVVSAGAFNRKVQFQTLTDTDDGMGGRTRAWTTTFTTWAHLEPWKGQEQFIAQQITPNMFMRVLLRYRPSQNITASMRMLYGTRTFNIRSVSVIAEAMTTIELLVQEIQASGSLHS